jgi:hypothetical protein
MNAVKSLAKYYYYLQQLLLLLLLLLLLIIIIIIIIIIIVVRVHAIKEYVRVEVKVHSLFTSKLDEFE